MYVRTGLVKYRITSIVLVLKTLSDHESEFMIKIPVAIHDGRHRIGTRLDFRKIQVGPAEIIGLCYIALPIFFDYTFLLNIFFGKCCKLLVKKDRTISKRTEHSKHF